MKEREKNNCSPIPISWPEREERYMITVNLAKGVPFNESYFKYTLGLKYL